MLLKSRALLPKVAGEEAPEQELARALLNQDALRSAASRLRERLDGAGLRLDLNREDDTREDDPGSRMGSAEESIIAVPAEGRRPRLRPYMMSCSRPGAPSSRPALTRKARPYSLPTRTRLKASAAKSKSGLPRSSPAAASRPRRGSRRSLTRKPGVRCCLPCSSWPGSGVCYLDVSAEEWTHRIAEREHIFQEEADIQVSRAKKGSVGSTRCARITARTLTPPQKIAGRFWPWRLGQGRVSAVLRARGATCRPSLTDSPGLESSHAALRVGAL